ncbi:hypothetical protein GNF86_21195 [Clostridium perfringens]
MVFAPNHPGLSWKLAEAYSLRGESEEATAWYIAAIDRDRFNDVKQTRAVLKLAALADWHRTGGDPARSVEAARAGMDILMRYRALAVDFREMDDHRNDREFDLSMLAARQANRLEKMLNGEHEKHAARQPMKADISARR